MWHDCVAYCDLEGSSMQHNLLVHVEVLHSVELVIAGGGAWDAVSPDKSPWEEESRSQLYTILSSYT